jgi:hypothetical protein
MRKEKLRQGRRMKDARSRAGRKILNQFRMLNTYKRNFFRDLYHTINDKEVDLFAVEYDRRSRLRGIVLLNDHEAAVEITGTAFGDRFFVDQIKFVRDHFSLFVDPRKNAQPACAVQDHGRQNYYGYEAVHAIQKYEFDADYFNRL